MKSRVVAATVPVSKVMEVASAANLADFPPLPPEAPSASSPSVRSVMQGNRKRDTRPELAVRKAVHRLGLRYRVASRPLPSERFTADLVFSSARVAVFVDGCFWHGCPEHFSSPRTNASYWGPKIARNQARDAAAMAALRAAGWVGLRVWEHEAPDLAADRIVRAVRHARGGGG
jgi:DNA mismatch endonuclease, patch repair protein